MKTFPVRYFTGKTSFAHQASLELCEDKWRITYQKLVPPPPKEEQALPTDAEDVPAQEDSLPEEAQALPTDAEIMPALA